MTITTPKINSIIKMNEFTLLATGKKAGNMYMCTDTQKLYYDASDTQRTLYAYTGVRTKNDLLYNITPSNGTTYYCWEENSLWLWQNKWIALYSDVTFPSAYVYDDDNDIVPLYANSNQQIVDNNGLLRDGSVVIRDENRIIKGRIFIDDGEDNIVISSYFGGGIRLLPNGATSTEGELYISDCDTTDESEPGYSFIRSEFHIYNNEAYVDYREKPEDDTNPYRTDKHKYMIFHEGNLDTSLIKEITPIEIYNKLAGTQEEKLPDVFAFNVDQLDGKHGEDFALKEHTHAASDITDFNSSAKDQASIVIGEIFNNITGNGIDASYNVTTRKLILDPNDFTLTFTGGARGSGKVINLSNTSIKLTVDPTEHVHQDYIDEMNDLQLQIDGIYKFDPTLYYTKIETDNKIEELAATETPVAGKPLLVNKDLDLPTNAISSSKLNHDVDFILDGDVTGHIESDLSTSSITIVTDASNIVSTNPEAGKALKLDQNLNLNANASSASQLDHTIEIKLTGEVTGTATLDTANNTISIPTIIDDDESHVLREDDIDVKIPSLNAQGYVPDTEINPEILKTALKPQGDWDPTSGAPSTTPKEGYLWIANASGDYDSKHYQVNDWCLYYNSKWNFINTNANVRSINGQQGDVTLTYSDVNAISDTYIDYTVGSTIPANKIVITDSNGHIAGATVDKLTNNFDIITDSTGDVVIDANSNNTSTDGTSDFDIKLTLTNGALDKITDRDGIKFTGKELSNNLTQKEFDFRNKVKLPSNFGVFDDNVSLSFEEIYSQEIIEQNIGDGTAKSFDISIVNTSYASDDIEVESVTFINKSSKQVCFLEYKIQNDKVIVKTDSVLSTNEITVKILCRYKNSRLAA